MTQHTPLPKSKREAKALGQSRYFTGTPCKFGHNSPRFVANGVCVECQHRRLRLKYSTDANHRNKRLDYCSKYGKENREELREKERARYKNPNYRDMKNKSRRASRQRHLTKRRAHEVEYRKINRESILKRNRQLWNKNRERYNQTSAKYREQNREQIAGSWARYYNEPQTKSKMLAHNASRRAKQKQRTPPPG